MCISFLELIIQKFGIRLVALFFVLRVLTAICGLYSCAFMRNIGILMLNIFLEFSVVLNVCVFYLSLIHI